MASQTFREPDADSVMQLHRFTGLPIDHCTDFIARLEPNVYSKIMAALDLQPTGNDLYDPIEDEPKIKAIIDAAAALAKSEVSVVDRELGFCHVVWRTIKRILLEEYDVDWLSPAEMNPWVWYD